jgi:phospholipid/cholesterol/gamma-HCH transport system substrate-binding protein
MNKHVSYTWVGSFVIIFVAILIWLVIWLSAMMGDKKYHHYQIFAKADISGLSLSSAVRFSGVKVGSVMKIQIDKNDSQAVIITIKVEDGTPVTTSTVATVQTEGITGVQYVGLKSLLATAPPLKKRPGEKMASIPFQPSLFMRLSSAIQVITGQIEKLSKSVQHILSDENWHSITDTLANVDKISANLVAQGKRIDSIMKDTRTTLKNTAKASEYFPMMVSNAKVALDDLARTAKEVKKTTTRAREVIASTGNLVDSVSQQIVPEVQRFAGTLDQIGNNVAVLTGEMKRNPSVIIRGRKPTAPGPGERVK